MKVEILRATVASGQDVFPGETHDLPENIAQLLIRMNKAKPTSEQAPKEESQTPAKKAK